MCPMRTPFMCLITLTPVSVVGMHPSLLYISVTDQIPDLRFPLYQPRLKGLAY